MANVAVETDECGAVDSVVYNADIDITRTPEENLAFAEESFARFYEAISSVDIEAEGIELLDTRLVNAPVLPEKFCQRSSPATITPPSTRTSTTPAHCVRGRSLTPNRKEEFDEYRTPCISIYLIARRS